MLKSSFPSHNIINPNTWYNICNYNFMIILTIPPVLIDNLTYTLSHETQL